MDVQKIIEGFVKTLEVEETEKNDGKTSDKKGKPDANSSVKVLLNLDKFEDYLVEEDLIDDSLPAKSLAELNKMEFKDGKLVDKNADKDKPDIMVSLLNGILEDENIKNSIDTDESGEIDSSEIHQFFKKVAGDDKEKVSLKQVAEYVNENTVSGFLNKIYNDSDVIEYLDVDGDGSISIEEKEKFEKFIQGDSDELTLDDLKEAYKNLLDGNFTYGESETKEFNPETFTPEDTLADTGAGNAQAVMPVSTPSGPSTGGGVSYGNYSAPPSNNPVTTSGESNTEMSMEELQKIQQEKITNEENARSEVEKVHSNENPQVQAAKQASEEAEQNYRDQLEKDEQISDELKQRQKENLDNINKEEKAIDELNTNITKSEGKIQEGENNISMIEAEITGLNDALSSLPSESDAGDNNEKKQEIAAKKAEIEGKIKDAQAKKKETEDNVNSEKETLKKYQDELKEHQENLDKFKEEQTKIEEEIKKEASPETLAALEAWNNAKTEYDSTKETELNTAQSNLETAQKELSEINSTIEEKKAQDTRAENAIAGTIPQDVVQKLDARLGSGFCAKVEQVAQNINCDPADLLGLMQSESGIDPSARNENGGATGLIQFMPSTAEGLGTTTAALSQMSGIDQLDYVEKFFTRNKSWTLGSNAKLSAGDLYALCFLPGVASKEVLCSTTDSLSWAYYANKGLDANGDGKITKTELGARVQSKYQSL